MTIALQQTGLETVRAGLVTDAQNYLPVITIAKLSEMMKTLRELQSDIMRENVHFGKVPGTDKPTLLKPGAELICKVFAMTPTFESVTSVEDWDGKDHNGEPLFFYHQRCTIARNGVVIGQGEGSCSSRESKYRFRWVSEFDLPPAVNKDVLKKRGGKISEFTFAIDKAETGGKYGKPAEHWNRFKDAISNGTAKTIQKAVKSGGTRDAYEIDSTVYRVPNEDIADVANTILKQAQKRAFVAATLIAGCMSEFFTQDVEESSESDSGTGGHTDYVEGKFSHVDRNPPPPENFGDSQPPAERTVLKDRIAALGKQAKDKLATADSNDASKIGAALSAARDIYAKNGSATIDELKDTVATLEAALA